MENNLRDSEVKALLASAFNLETICTKECNQAKAGDDNSQAHLTDTVGINSKINMAINKQDLTKTSTETATKNIEFENQGMK